MEDHGVMTYTAPPAGMLKKIMISGAFWVYSLFFIVLLYITAALYPSASPQNRWNLVGLCVIYAGFLICCGRCAFGNAWQVTEYAEWDGQTLVCRDERAEYTIEMRDVQISCLCVGAAFTSLVLVSDATYLVLNRCNAFSWLGGGGESGEQFHALVRALQGYCKQSETVFNRRGQRKHAWIRIPRWVFELDCYSGRARRTAEDLRKNARGS